jgi:hypothetical protein
VTDAARRRGPRARPPRPLLAPRRRVGDPFVALGLDERPARVGTGHRRCPLPSPQVTSEMPGAPIRPATSKTCCLLANPGTGQPCPWPPHAPRESTDAPRRRPDRRARSLWTPAAACGSAFAADSFDRAFLAPTWGRSQVHDVRSCPRSSSPGAVGPKGLLALVREVCPALQQPGPAQKPPLSMRSAAFRPKRLFRFAWKEWCPGRATSPPPAPDSARSSTL